MPIHIDSDCGVDDALAIQVLARKAVIASATSVWGNVSGYVAALNIASLVQPGSVVTRDRGWPQRWTSQFVHGVDGLGGEARSVRARGRGVHPVWGDPAAAIAEFAGTHGADGSLLCIGPLTNLARAHAEHGPRMSRLGRTVVLGGFGLDARPWTAMARDSNTLGDLRATRALTSVAIDWVGMDVSRKFRITSDDLPRDWIEIGREYGLRRRDVTRPNWSMPCHDLVAAAAVLTPSAFEWADAVPTIVGDRLRFDRSVYGSCRVATGFDASVVRRLLRESLWI